MKQKLRVESFRTRNWQRSNASEFDLLLTREVAGEIGRAQAFVRELIESGRLEAHQDSAFGTRKSNVVTRRSVLLYLAETANYDPAFLVIRMEALLKNLNRPALIRMVNTATKRLNTIVE